MEYNYATSQAPDKGVQKGPEPRPTPNAILAMTQGKGVQIGPEPMPTPNAVMAMTQANISGFGGNLIEVGIIMNEDKSATYTSKAYPANADGKQRPGAIVEYSSEFSVGEGIGGVPELPWGYIRAEFLESTGTQYIITGVPAYKSDVFLRTCISSNKRMAVCSMYQANAPAYGEEMQFFFERKNGLRQSNALVTGKAPDSAPQLKCFLPTETTEAPFLYTFNISWSSGYLRLANEDTGAETQLTFTEADEPVFLNTKPVLFLFARNTALGDVPTGRPEFFCTGCQIFEFRAKKSNTVLANFIPSINPQGRPGMYDKVSNTLIQNSGTGEFIVGFTFEQALQLNKLPATGGSVTVSLPWEAQLVQYNAKVEQALQTAKNKGWTITVQYRSPKVDSPIYNKYAECTTVDEMLAVNAEYRDDLTEDNSWVYLLPNLIDGRRLMSSSSSAGTKKLTYWAIPLPKTTNASDAFSGCSQLKYFHSELPVLVHALGMFYGCDELVEVVLDLPKLRNAQLMFEYSDKFTRFKGQLPSLLRGDAMFFGTKLEIFDSYLPALTNGVSMFYNCKLDKESALRVLTSIPTWTDGASHPITMGIHIDYQNDADVLTAIENATAKGWTVTTQWTGTPTNTASTFGTRRIWVRKIQDEQGEYVDADDTRWQVEWCDSISAPDNSTPEDHGYELYRSVDAAVAYWELTPWVASAQENEFIQEI